MHKETQSRKMCSEVPKEAKREREREDGERGDREREREQREESGLFKA